MLARRITCSNRPHGVDISVILFVSFNFFLHLCTLGPVVQWIEFKIPVLTIGVRISTGSHSCGLLYQAEGRISFSVKEQHPVTHLSGISSAPTSPTKVNIFFENAIKNSTFIAFLAKFRHIESRKNHPCEDFFRQSVVHLIFFSLLWMCN